MSKWSEHCNRRGINPHSADLKEIIHFLTDLFHAGLSYSAINTAKSALSSILQTDGNTTWGEHPMIKRFMKGVFNMRPQRPRYNYTWDVETVLRFLDNYHPLAEISLKILTLKTVTLTALVTGQRCQSIHLMDLKHMQQTEQKLRFVIEEKVKTSAPGKKQPVLILPKFDMNEKRCVCATMIEYIRRTSALRDGQSKVFISYTKPHGQVTGSTISRWIKTTLALAGIDTDIFKSHSTRSASTSRASRQSLPLTSIMKAGAWRRDSTFRIFYNKPLDDESDFAMTILDHNTNKDE